jgi:hypothetical protein
VQNAGIYIEQPVFNFLNDTVVSYTTRIHGFSPNFYMYTYYIQKHEYEN